MNRDQARFALDEFLLLSRGALPYSLTEPSGTVKSYRLYGCEGLMRSEE